MQMIHQQVKGQLHGSNLRYKQRIDLKRREVNFEVGDLVLAHPWKEWFPKHEYNKLDLKKIDLCKVLRKFSANSYEIELPLNMGISLIFNTTQLYPYKEFRIENQDEQQKI